MSRALRTRWRIAARWLAAFVAAAMLTVLAIGAGWLPLCPRAAGMSTLGGGVLLVSLLELLRRRARRC